MDQEKQQDYEAILEEVQQVQSPDRKGDYLPRLILRQALLCAAVFGLLFAVKTYRPSVLQQCKEAYAAQKVITVSDVKGLVEQVKEKLMKPKAQGGMGGKDETAAAAKKNASFAPVLITKPVVTPLHGKITSPYGIRTDPITGKKSSFHTGLDIAAGEGENIVAAYYGKVKFSGWMDSYGNCIILEHGNGLETLYAHCSKLLVQKGTYVREGEVIALVGSTGNVTGPHLHFELRVDGKRYSPLWILRLKGEDAV